VVLSGSEEKFGGLFWTRQWPFESDKMSVISYFSAEPIASREVLTW